MYCTPLKSSFESFNFVFASNSVINCSIFIRKFLSVQRSLFCRSFSKTGEAIFSEVGAELLRCSEFFEGGCLSGDQNIRLFVELFGGMFRVFCITGVGGDLAERNLGGDIRILISDLVLILGDECRFGSFLLKPLSAGARSEILFLPLMLTGDGPREWKTKPLG